jgi:ABC-type transporter lipoprotein component MlaA
VGLRSVDAINDRAAFLEEIRENRETSLDYYVFVRNAWTQNRERRVRDGASILENEAQDDLYQFDDE